ncbi:glycosyltransferase [Vreelandella sulfidaeris]|uniref:glycosyltransferase n=1 Tax=Vreelandella sulfidaeris TaxID=115553 RepID=UPI0035EADCD5
MTNFNKDLVHSAIFKPHPFSENSAWLGHLQFAYFLIRVHRPKIFVELGSHWGHSYFAFCKSIKELGVECATYAIDTWEGDEHAGNYEGNVFEFVNTHNEEYYKSFSTLLKTNFDNAVSYFSDRSIDLLHIDGLHTYEAVKHDFEVWLPKLAPGAIVIFHDTTVRERGFGVWKLWEELCAKYPNNLNLTHSHGLGVLQLPGANPDRQHEWLGSEEKNKVVIKEYFSSIGTLEQLRYQLIVVKNLLDENAIKLKSLNKDIELRDQTISFLNGELDVRENTIDSLKNKNALKEEEHNFLLEEQTKELNELINSNKLYAQQHQTILDSKSWQLTRPLREGVALIRRIKKLLYLTLTIKKEYGLRKSFQKAKEVFKVHGINGIKNRVRDEYVRFKSHEPTLGVSSVNTEVNKQELQLDSGGNYSLVKRDAPYIYIEPDKPSNLYDMVYSLKKKTMFSIVVPVYNTEVWMLKSAIHSVQRQWYDHWELILVNDASTREETINLLSELNIDRIKVLNLTENMGIATATNSGIEESIGEFIVFMDHDDELTPDCLYELAKKIDEDNPDYVYSDEDKISEKMEYVGPHFKPDWSPETLMSIMYTSHVSCIRKSLVKQVGGLNPQLDGCQDWDLVLRVTEQTNKISHIAKVLYHWRVLEGSVALSLKAKPYVESATIKLKNEALLRRNLKGELEKVPGRDGYWKVNYFPQGNPLISIVIPSKDNFKILSSCLNSIEKNTRYDNYEIILVDNGSSDIETLEYLEKIKEKTRINIVEHDSPFNFSALCNIGAKKSNGEVLLFLNDDIEVISHDWLERLCGYAQLDHVGAVGAKLLYPGGKYIQHCGIINSYNGPGHAFLHKPRNHDGYFLRCDIEYNWSAVTGACLMLETAKFKKIGGFDEALPIAYNDVDLCFTLLNHGYFNVLCPSVELIHHESVSRGKDDIDPIKMKRLDSEKKKLYKKHPKFYSFDPFHNTNLKFSSDYFDYT